MKTKMENRLGAVSRWAAVVLLGMNLIGCASVTMPPPMASATNVEKLRAAKLAPAKAGVFGLAAGRNPDMDHKLEGLRGSTLAPTNGSYSQQLRDELVVELKAAGLYDEGSRIVIAAQLTDSQVDAAISVGTARLGAHFTVHKADQRVFDKDVVVDARWESSFVGAEAIPAAMNQYGALYKTLIGKLFDDPEFRSALAR